MNEVATSYWIQEQAPNGEWHESVGLEDHMTLSQAHDQLKRWRESFTNGPKARLVMQVIVPLIEIE